MSRVTVEVTFKCKHSLITQHGDDVKLLGWRLIKKSENICENCKHFN